MLVGAWMSKSIGWGKVRRGEPRQFKILMSLLNG